MRYGYGFCSFHLYNLVALHRYPEASLQQGLLRARERQLEPRSACRDTQGGTEPRLDGLTWPAYVIILDVRFQSCMADAYNGQGYDREGARQ
jgi:hypothetical protein